MGDMKKRSDIKAILNCMTIIILGMLFCAINLLLKLKTAKNIYLL